MTRKGWIPPWRWILAVATVLGFSSWFQAYRLSLLTAAPPPPKIDLLLLNLVYWYVPAALTPVILRIAHRFRFDRAAWRQTIAVHIFAALTYSIVHALCMLSTRTVLFANAGKPPLWSWWSFLQRLYFTNLDWTLMTYTTIVGLSHAIEYYRELQARRVRTAQLETKLVEAQLKTLQAELHPHFLFNTLHAISALVHKDPDLADRMISRLSDLLRLTLDTSGAQMILLKDEIEFLEKYLEIERTRFQDRLDVQFHVDADVLDAQVPRLILQPLVENAIRHGIAPHPGAALLEVTARREGNTLWMQVRDDGAGLSGSALTALETGIGLSNTRARLQCLYGSDHRLEFSNRQGGLAVRVVVPLRMPGEAPARTPEPRSEQMPDEGDARSTHVA